MRFWNPFNRMTIAMMLWTIGGNISASNTTKENIKKLHKNIRNCDFAWSKIFVWKFSRKMPRRLTLPINTKLPIWSLCLPTSTFLVCASKTVQKVHGMIRIQGFFLYQFNQITKSTSDCQFIDEEMLCTRQFLRI